MAIDKNIWITREGEKILISEMKDSHLINTFKMLKRKGFISPATLNAYVFGSYPNGDMAQLAFDQEYTAILDAPVYPKMGEIELEIEKRGLKKEVQ